MSKKRKKEGILHTFVISCWCASTNALGAFWLNDRNSSNTASLPVQLLPDMAWSRVGHNSSDCDSVKSTPNMIENQYFFKKSWIKIHKIENWLKKQTYQLPWKPLLQTMRQSPSMSTAETLNVAWPIAQSRANKVWQLQILPCFLTKSCQIRLQTCRISQWRQKVICWRRQSGIYPKHYKQ